MSYYEPISTAPKFEHWVPLKNEIQKLRLVCVCQAGQEILEALGLKYL